MKKSLKIIAAGIGFLFATSFALKAQDVAKTNPTLTKVLADTAGVRMMKVTLKPGEEMIMHTHPAQMVYCLQGGQLTVNYKSGKKEVFDLKEGDSMQAPPDPPHTTKNTGNSTVSFLEIEIMGSKKQMATK